MYGVHDPTASCFAECGDLRSANLLSGYASSVGSAFGTLEPAGQAAEQMKVSKRTRACEGFSEVPPVLRICTRALSAMKQCRSRNFWQSAAFAVAFAMASSAALHVCEVGLFEASSGALFDAACRKFE